MNICNTLINQVVSHVQRWNEAYDRGANLADRLIGAL